MSHETGLYNVVQLLRGLLRHDQLLGVPREHHKGSELATDLPLLQPLALAGGHPALHGRHVPHGLENGHCYLPGIYHLLN